MQIYQGLRQTVCQARSVLQFLKFVATLRKDFQLLRRMYVEKSLGLEYLYGWECRYAAHLLAHPFNSGSFLRQIRLHNYLNFQ